MLGPNIVGLGYPRIQNFNQGRLVYRCTCRRNSCLGKYLICSNTASVPWTPHYHWLWIIRLLSFVKSNCSLDRFYPTWLLVQFVPSKFESFERICFGFLSQIQKSRLPANKFSNLKITVTPTFRLYPSENIQMSTNQSIHPPENDGPDKFVNFHIIWPICGLI